MKKLFLLLFLLSFWGTTEAQVTTLTPNLGQLSPSTGRHRFVILMDIPIGGRVGYGRGMRT
jgi:hypothetical protein